MVQPGPDTTNEYTPSGYKRSDATIRGFSTTRDFGKGVVERVLMDGKALPSRWVSHKVLIGAREICFVFGKKRERLDRPMVDLTGYRIVWRDEFDGDKIDASKWESPAMERQGSSLWHPRNVSVKDGAAVFKIRKTDDPRLRYESACLRTTRGYDPNDRLYSFTRSGIIPSSLTATGTRSAACGRRKRCPYLPTSHLEGGAPRPTAVRLSTFSSPPCA